MAEALRTPPAADVPQPRGDVGQWAPTARLVADQVIHASRDAWRTPASMLVTLIFPVLFLVVSALAVGDVRTGPGADAVIQRLVPAAAVFATAMAAFVMLAFGVAVAGEQGVLKRLRGTPLPLWAHLAGRTAAAAWVAVLGTALMVVVGAAGYGLEVTARTLPAALFGLLVMIASFAALGFAVAAVVRSSQAVLSLTMGAVVLLGFVSDLFAFGTTTPRWLELIGWALPLRHAVEVLAAPFEAGVTGGGVAAGSLVALLGWGTAGALVALRFLGRERAMAVGPRLAGRVGRRAGRVGAFAYGSPSALGLVWGQLRHANRGIWREPVFAFFALAMPALFVVLLPTVTGNPDIDGVSFAVSMTTGMPVFGLALTAYVALPETVAAARDKGLLKRLRGTPVPAWAYLAGRIVSVFWVGALTVTIVLGAGWLLYDATPVAAGLPVLVLVLLAGTACLAALGMAVASLAPTAESVPAITLASFLPLVFVSGIFPLGDALPEVVAAAAGWLPLAPMVDATREAFTAGAVAGRELAIVGGWTLVGIVVALTRFRWEP